MNKLHALAAIGAAATLGMAGTALAAGHGEGGDPDPETITAKVVDQSCYLVHDLHGETHKMCAEVCAKKGVPLVLLAEDGQLYLPVSMAMPSDGFNEKLVEHAEQTVEVTGTVIEKAGSKSIVVDKIAAAS